MEYEWDETKRIQNRAVHDVDFTAMDDFEWDNAVIFEDRRKEYGETRFVAFAPIKGRLHCVVFTSRQGNIRIISLRKANRREVYLYEKKNENDAANGERRGDHQSGDCPG
jgi:uncharacterized protein